MKTVWDVSLNVVSMYFTNCYFSSRTYFLGGFYIRKLDFLYSNIISFCTVRIKSEKIHNSCGRRTMRNRFEIYLVAKRFSLRGSAIGQLTKLWQWIVNGNFNSFGLTLPILGRGGGVIQPPPSFFFSNIKGNQDNLIFFSDF